jgi:hypothetical protein
MSTDLFDRLAESAVPPPPAQLDRAVHERLNRALVIGHVLDFAMNAIPYACLHLAKAVGGFIALTVTGEYPKQPDKREDTPDIDDL